jgi:hypothetical protein
MEAQLSQWIALIDNAFFPVLTLLLSLQSISLSASPVPFQIVFAFIAFFHDSVIFPVWFSYTVDALIVAKISSWAISFIKWLADVIPVW